MPPTIVLRRLSTLVVGALFAVAFVIGGASASQITAAQGQTLVGPHISASNSHARAVHQSSTQQDAPTHLQLAATTPTADDTTPPEPVVERTDAPVIRLSATPSTSSDRAPPAV